MTPGLRLTGVKWTQFKKRAKKNLSGFFSFFFGERQVCQIFHPWVFLPPATSTAFPRSLTKETFFPSEKHGKSVSSGHFLPPPLVKLLSGGGGGSILTFNKIPPPPQPFPLSDPTGRRWRLASSVFFVAPPRAVLLLHRHLAPFPTRRRGRRDNSWGKGRRRGKKEEEDDVSSSRGRRRRG